MLTDTQAAQFQEDGYLVLEEVFPIPEVEALREAAEDPSLQRDLQARGSGECCVHLLELTAKHEAFRRLARDPRLVTRVARLIGPDLQLQHSKLATKPPKPGAGAFGWHQDFAYFPHTNPDLVAVMVMLDDATPDNGGMYAVRGSHRLGLLDHSREGWFAGVCQHPRPWEEQPERVVPLMARAGGITLHHCLTLHGSPPNRSGLPRRGVVFQYRAGHAYQLADHVWADTGYQVHGVPGGQVRCVAQAVALPRHRGRPNAGGEPFGNVYAQIGSYARRWNDQERKRPEPAAAAVSSGAAGA